MAQTLVESGADTIHLQHVGRWKSADMPAHYTRAQAAKQNAVAKFIYGK